MAAPATYLVIGGERFPIPDDLTLNELLVLKQAGVQDVMGGNADSLLRDPAAIVGLVRIVWDRAGKKYDPAAVGALRISTFAIDTSEVDAAIAAAGGVDPPPNASASQNASDAGDQETTRGSSGLLASVESSRG